MPATFKAGRFSTVARLPLTLIFALSLVRLGPADAQSVAPALSFPVECVLGRTCSLQNYFDHEPGPLARDYRCGLLTYDGHDGTDIRLPNLAAMMRGVPVVAAADGIVHATRDGMADGGLRAGKAGLVGREAGNSVVIDHGNGWHTQYSHMRQGSVHVKRGDAVKRGQRLGLIGLSGWTEFPHLHFSVRYRGKNLDPFAGPGEHRSCDLTAQPLWSAAESAALTYTPTGLLSAGFAGAAPSHADVKAVEPPEPAVGSPAIVFLITAYGVQAGDEEYLRITAPQGAVLTEIRRRIVANKAEWFAYSGRKLTTPSWPAGTYRGEYTLTRQEPGGPRAVISEAREMRIREASGAAER